ncbi:AAA family ATPase [Nonomuraea dietziae]|uniref:AAA family ATPase n=1 Tax=Nonomuraea dietziae TaxID=65515 RepID=UPI0031D9D554
MFNSPADVSERLAAVDYLSDASIATSVFLAAALGKPLLAEGPAGVGKTQLAKAGRAGDGREPHQAPVLRGPRRGQGAVRVELQEAAPAHPGDQLGRRHLLRGVPAGTPLLKAIRSAEPTVLLIDETDKADVEVEGLLLELLSDFQITIPELGTIEGDAQGRSSC